MTLPVNAEMRSLLLTTMGHLRPFVEALAGDAHAVMQWRVLPERPGVDKQKGVPANRRGSILEYATLEWLIKQNQAGYAVYVSVNEYPAEPIKGRGAGRKQNILRMRAAHVDLDIDKGNAPPGWEHGTKADASCTSWVPRLLFPTLQVESVGGPHLYWVYKPGQEASVADGEGINRALQQALHSDPAVCDAARILRAPGFNHWKTGQPRLVTLAFHDTERLFSAQELKTCLDDLGLPPQPTAQRVHHVRSHDGEDVEPVEMSIDEYARALKAARDFVVLRSMTPQGARGSMLMKTICPKLHDLGITTEHAMRLLRLWADNKCDPTPSEDGEWPATDDMLRDRWMRSEESRDNPRGQQIYEWRGGLEADFEPVTKAPGEEAAARHARTRQNGEAAGEEPAAAEDADAEEEPAAEPAAAVEEEEDEQGDIPDEPDEAWIEDARMERVAAGILPVPVRKQHRITVNEVLAVLARHPALYQFDGKIVHIKNTTTGWRIRELTKSSVITYATDHCAFFKFKYKRSTEEWTTEDCGPPPWLAGELLDAHHFTGFRDLKGLTMIPRIKADGTVSQRGYDTETCTVYEPDEELKDLHVGETREEALQALEVLGDVIADFPLVGKEQKAATFAAMLTPFCRRAMNGPAPMFMIDGNRPNIGKSYLLQVITSMFSHDVMNMNWSTDKSNSEYHNIQRLAAAFMSGQTIISLDNLSGSFGDPTIDKLLTLSRWSERILGTTQIFSADNHMTVLGTANNITLVSDIWRRVITIRLMDTGLPRPTPRYELATYLPTVRKKMVEACLTILRAFHVAGRPIGSNLLGSFENWSRWVASALVWLGLPDITKLVGTAEDAAEDSHGEVEREALVEAITLVSKELNKVDVGITAQELTEALEKERSDPMVIEKRFPTLNSLLSRHGQPITRDHTAALLRRHRDNSVRDSDGNLKMLVNQKDPGRRKSAAWKIVSLGQGIAVAGPDDTTQ